MDDSDGGLDNADLIWRKESVGLWLGWARADRGFSLRQLEQLSGVDDAEIYRVETGQQECRLETLIRLCGPLGIAPAWILDRAVGSNVGIFFERLMTEPEFNQFADHLGASSGELKKRIAGNLAAACTLASSLLRGSIPHSRLGAVSFPQPEWEKAFRVFADRIAPLDESLDRAAILRGLLARPFQELKRHGLIPESVLKDQVTDARLPKSKRKAQQYGWAPYVTPYPRPLKSG